MKRKLICALLAAIGVSANSGVGAATVVHDTNEYTVTYDNGGFFGGISSWSGDFFAWSFPQNQGQALASLFVSDDSDSASYTLGTFTLQAKAGFVLEDLRSSAGGAFTTFGDATANVGLTGSVAFNGGPATLMAPQFVKSPEFGPIGLWTIDTVNSSNGQYTSVVVSGVVYSFDVFSANSSSFAGLIGHPNTGPSFHFNVATVPVPEPETYALMLAGLGLVGMAARRRKRA